MNELKDELITVIDQLYLTSRAIADRVSEIEALDRSDMDWSHLGSLTSVKDSLTRSYAWLEAFGETLPQPYRSESIVWKTKYLGDVK